MRTPRILLNTVVAALFWAAPAPADDIVVTAVGDIMLAGSGEAAVRRHGCDYPFAATAGVLQQGDIAVGNLEAPLSRRGVEYPAKKFRFRADPDCAPALRRAGFSVLTLANNHIMDFGDAALAETLDSLATSGIRTVGAGLSLVEARREAVLRVKDATVAFLAYSLTQPVEFFAAADRPGTAPGYTAFVKNDIARVRRSADYVIVSFHWGQEGETEPTPHQVAAAHAAIDAGADVVLGHHPHVLQGIEHYRQGIIFYSLGNFAFGSLSRTADLSVIARITLNDGIKEVELVPINVRNSEVRYQPRPLGGEQGEAVVARLRRFSRDLGTTVVSSGGKYLVRGLTDVPVVERRGGATYAQAVRGH